MSGHSLEEQSSSPREKLARALDHARHFLPAQGPIGVFVHHNTLHAFQHLPFHQALEEAGALYGAQTYYSESRFRALYAAGRISWEDVEVGLAQVPPGAERDFLRKTLLFPLWDEPARVESSPAWSGFLEMVPAASRTKMVEQTRSWLSGLLAKVGQSSTLTDLAEAIGGPAIGEEVRRAAQAPARWRLFPRQMAPAGVEAETYLKLLVNSAEKQKVSASALWRAESSVAGKFLCELFGKPLDLRQFQRALETAPESIGVRALFRVCGSLPPHAELHPDALPSAASAELANSFLIRWTAAFLDQGVASWNWPHRERGLYAAVSAHLLEGRAPLPAWLEPLRQMLARCPQPEALILHLLPKHLEEPLDQFFTGRLLQLAGWAGMVSRLEGSGEISTPAPKLMDFLALRLALDHLADLAQEFETESLPSSEKQSSAWRMFVLAQAMGWSAPELLQMAGQEWSEWEKRLWANSPRLRCRVWQEAYETHYRQRFLTALAHNVQRPLSQRQPSSPWVQVAFCIDDREEAIRRHLEEADPTLETLAIAGFFGVAMAYRGLDDAEFAPLCPVVVTPSHAVEEKPLEHHRPHGEKRQGRRRWGTLLAHHLEHGLRGWITGSLLVWAQGLLAALTLPLWVLFPRWMAHLKGGLHAALLPRPQTKLSAERSDSAEGSGSAGGVLQQGFTVTEMADRVATSLNNMGIAQRLAPLVVFLGHGASTSNNPHQSAYDCGACGGRHGGANARLVAQMANHPKVRELLSQRGISIPAGTHFLGGMHNTTTDGIELYDTQEVPEALRSQLAAFIRMGEAASALSAHERCRRFASAPEAPSPEQALIHVRTRAVDLSQARPELGHVTNAACVVGRRSLTRGVFLDRRSFMVSYDPTEDPQGSVLERLLVAVGPVGAGINLEYYFSCVDNARFGCGTKLPHNLSGHLGVMDGAASDLRTGLPSQMIEIHEPMRLLLVVESTPEILTAICQRQPGVAELVMKEWVQLVSVDPTTHAMQRYTPQGWEACKLPSLAPPRATRSGEYYAGQRDFLTPALLSPVHVHVA